MASRKCFGTRIGRMGVALATAVSALLLDSGLVLTWFCTQAMTILPLLNKLLALALLLA